MSTRPSRATSFARVSELLQAQLLQDININPVQPSLSETNLNIITCGGPARPGFDEFTPLFERNQAQLNATGELGNEGTRADEAVVSGICGRYSISAGQFHYHNDGFRHNDHLNHDIYNLFTQAALTPELNAQAEVRRLTSNFGDRAFNFESDPSNPDFRRRVDQDTARATRQLPDRTLSLR